MHANLVSSEAMVLAFHVGDGLAFDMFREILELFFVQLCANSLVKRMLTAL